MAGNDWQESASMKIMFLVLVVTILFAGDAPARTEGGIIINEVGNSGADKKMYTGGEYVELLVTKSGGLTLAGWYITDLTSPDQTPKEGEGYVRFSDGDSSIFRQAIPQGTYILLCLGTKSDLYGESKMSEDVSLTDGNNRIVVFAYSSPKHLEPKKGKIVLAGKDNLALVSEWKENAAIAVLSWGGSSSWKGCRGTTLPAERVDNGKIAYFVPKGRTEDNFNNTVDPALWVSTSDVRKTTPGNKNPDRE